MNNKISKHFSLYESSIEKVKEMAKEKDASHSAIVELAIASYYKEKEEKYQVVKKMLSDLLDEKVKSIEKTLDRVWVTGNIIDGNTKMLVEFWNHHFFVDDAGIEDEDKVHETLISTEKTKTKALIQAEQLNKDRIKGHRQRKLEWEEKRKHNNVGS